MEDIGYETHNSLLNLGSLSIFITLYAAKVVLFFLLLMINKGINNARFSKTIKEWGVSLFFGELVAIVIEAYMEFITSAYLNLKYPLSQTSGERLGVIFAYISIVVSLLIVPVLAIYVFTQPLK